MNDVCQIVVNKIIEKLEQGVIPWRQPWTAGFPRNYITKRAYSGINVILLGMLEYTHPYFLTWNQVTKLKAKVKFGEKPHIVVYYKSYDAKEEKFDEETGEAYNEKVKKYMLRYYSLYNIEQTTLPLPETKEVNPIELCEDVVNNMYNEPEIVHKYLRAYYSPARDLVNIPEISNFHNSELYYGTLFHELIHSTGHKSRLNRSTITEAHAFGDALYSEEELIAELGAAFLSAHAGISNKTLDDSSSYINGWLNVIKKKPDFIFKCSTKAKRAAEFILNNPGESSGYLILMRNLSKCV
jgi:antirestriction protein ArdC